MTTIYVVIMRDLNSFTESKITSIHATRIGAEKRAIEDKDDDMYYDREYTVHKRYLED